MEYKELIKHGENLRENEGKKEEALKVFADALEVAEGIKQIAEATAHIGLTQWHMKNFEKARATFEGLLALGEKKNESGVMALAYRNLSRPEITPDPKLQVDYAGKAFDSAKKGDNTDLTWYAQGVVKVALENGMDEEAKKWLKVEESELNKVLDGEVKVDNSNHVIQIWQTGYMMDKARVENDPSGLPEALKIAQDSSLSIRIEHIETLMEKMEG